MAAVVIVGGGLMGLSTAFHLRRLDPGVDVTVLERANIGAAASGASAAGVRAMGRDPAERALALASLRRWPELDRELEGPTGYRRGGGLRIALDDKSWDAAPGWAAEQRADGVPLEVLDAAAARELAPGIGPGCLGGVYSPIDGQAGAMETVEAFATAARRQGARVEEGAAVRALSVEGGRVDGVAAGTARHRASAPHTAAPDAPDEARAGIAGASARLFRAEDLLQAARRRRVPDRRRLAGTRGEPRGESLAGPRG